MPIRFLRSFFFLITGTPGFRFRKYDKPTQATFKQLFDSAGFIKEKDDTANTVDQGFVKKAQDTASIARNTTADVDGFTKTVLPHQLPNVFANPLTPLTSIAVTSANNVTGRTGGTGKDFYIENTLAVTSISPSIIVTQGAPGEDVTLDLSTASFDFGKVKVNALDPTATYLDSAVESYNTCRLEINTIVSNEKLSFKTKDKLYEMTMYAGTNVQFALDFPANQGAVGGCWEGWVKADGGTYLNSSSVAVTVINMPGTFPVAWGTALYPTIGNQVDSAALAGANNIALSTPELPPHLHTNGSLVNTADGSHTHNFQIKYDAAVEAGGSGTTTNGLVASQTLPDLHTMTTLSSDPLTHTHTISGSTGLTGSGTAHENRPPFTVVGYVTYIG